MIKNYIAPLLGLALGTILGTLLLSWFGFIAAAAAPIVSGLLNATQRQAESQDQNVAAASRVYEVASIRPRSDSGGMVSWYFAPDGFTARNATLQMLIDWAYGVEDYQISGAVKWLNTETFNVEAKVDSSTTEKMRNLTSEQRRVEQQPMLQALLANRFNLTIHRETKELPVYALIVAKGGPKIQEAKPGDTYPNGMKDLNGKGHGGVMGFGRGRLTGQGVPMAFLARMLSHRQLGRPVVDQTSLTGKYDFTLQWTPDESRAPMFSGSGGGQQVCW